jgi:hypothetical protein
MRDGRTSAVTPRPIRTSSTKTPSKSAAQPKRRTIAFASVGRASSFLKQRNHLSIPKPRRTRRINFADMHPSAKLPLSILTDFEEFAVYDCRVEPRLSDKVSVARVLYLNFREYVPEWEEIAKIFAREAILKGSYDKFAESTKAKRGTAEIDDAFLDENFNARVRFSCGIIAQYAARSSASIFLFNLRNLRFSSETRLTQPPLQFFIFRQFNSQVA